MLGIVIAWRSPIGFKLEERERAESQRRCYATAMPAGAICSRPRNLWCSWSRPLRH